MDVRGLIVAGFTLVSSAVISYTDRIEALRKLRRDLLEADQRPNASGQQTVYLKEAITVYPETPTTFPDK